ncbi:MAG: deoxynucleoside kinase [Bryobacteraceae bacterium]|jgi:deoxyadenosine/deoxycytidine kinase
MPLRACFKHLHAIPAKGFEPLQRYLMHARADAWKRTMGSPSVVFDRSIDEDIEVFCNMHKRAGLLTPHRFDVLAQLAATLQAQIPAPDLIVYVTADYEGLLRRIRSATAPPAIISFRLQLPAGTSSRPA